MPRSYEFDGWPGVARQAGVQYVAANAPTLASGNIVPRATTLTVREDAAEEVIMDKTNDPVRLETSGHKLVWEGAFRLKAGTAVPNYGSTLTDADGKKWLVCGDAPSVSVMVGQYPAEVRMRLEYWPGAQGSL